MARRVRTSKEKRMKPNFFVFCEGETEVAYVMHLRSKYRVPIQIIPRKSDSNISCRYIENCKKGYELTDRDQTFLMYDLDVAGVLEQLKCIPGATLLVSNPCVELWFLLHCVDVSAEQNQNACVKMYKKYSGNYSKGKLGVVDVNIFAAGEENAIQRAKKLNSPNNPSTTVYKLIEAIREV